MKYKVVFFDDDGSVEKALFRSYSQTHAWDFVRLRLSSESEKVRDAAMKYVVRDNAGTFLDAPADVLALKNYNKINVRKSA